MERRTAGFPAVRRTPTEIVGRNGTAAPPVRPVKSILLLVSRPRAGHPAFARRHRGRPVHALPILLLRTAAMATLFAVLLITDARAAEDRRWTLWTSLDLDALTPKEGYHPIGSTSGSLGMTFELARTGFPVALRVEFAACGTFASF